MNSIDRYTKKFRKFYKKSFPIVKIKVKYDDVTTTFLIFGHIEITCHCSTLTSSHFTLIFCLSINVVYGTPCITKAWWIVLQSL